MLVLSCMRSAGDPRACPAGRETRRRARAWAFVSLEPRSRAADLSAASAITRPTAVRVGLRPSPRPSLLPPCRGLLFCHGARHSSSGSVVAGRQHANHLLARVRSTHATGREEEAVVLVLLSSPHPARAPTGWLGLAWLGWGAVRTPWILLSLVVLLLCRS